MKNKKTKKESEKKEEVHEIFEIKKDGEEKIVETEGTIEEGTARKEEIIKENRLLRKILIFIGIFLLVIVLVFIIRNASTKFNYNGVKFTVIEDGKLTFYQTSFPIIYNKTNATFNIYLRNDPRKLEKKVPAPETPISIDNTVINLTEEFNCNGDGIIAVANIVNLYGAVGKKIMRDENASCDPWGRYMYLVIQPGNETSIEKFGSNCYKININNCEILEGTERFIASILVKINSDLSKK